MIKWASGNPFDREVDIRVNTVNCVGVMGKGIALEFKRRYPRMFFAYSELCRGGVIQPGTIHVWDNEPDCTIINVATKRDWKNPSQFKWVWLGLGALTRHLVPLGPVTVTLPALGCGNGGLEWERVKPMIQDALSNIEAVVYVYPPESSR